MSRFNGNLGLDGLLLFPSGANNDMAVRAISSESETGEPASGQIRFVQVGNEEGYWYLQNNATADLSDFDAKNFPSGQRIAILDDIGGGVDSLNSVVDAVNLASPDGSITINANGQNIELAATSGSSKSITVENPTAAEDISLFHSNNSYTITQMTAVLVGSTSQTVTWTVRKNSDRSATGTEVVTGGTVTTNITTGDDVVSFNSDTIDLDDFVWLETTAQGGTVTEFHLTIHMRKT